MVFIATNVFWFLVCVVFTSIVTCMYAVWAIADDMSTILNSSAENRRKVFDKVARLEHTVEWVRKRLSK